MARYGVTYLEEDLPPALSGFVVFVNESPLVVVNKDDSDVRRRFSSAHELGHVLLAHHDTFYVDLSRSDGVPPDYNWRYEREANDFASALLIPADLVRRELHAAINPTARLLAERFRVSAQAMSIRLSALGLVLEASGEVEIPF
jgi:Zn-dependent peptidase ImmA (M78 family)